MSKLMLMRILRAVASLAMTFEGREGEGRECEGREGGGLE
jgi:hypothetical protein